MSTADTHEWVGSSSRVAQYLARQREVRNTPRGAAIALIEALHEFHDAVDHRLSEDEGDLLDAVCALAERIKDAE